MLAGRDPLSAEQLVAGPGGGRARTPGFDLTFSAPKSVSLLYGVGDAELRAAAVEAHEVAVAAALAYLADRPPSLGRGQGGALRLPAAGPVAAGFCHRASGLAILPCTPTCCWPPARSG